jgi:SMI1 / KNR4 family (SUKH-1)
MQYNKLIGKYITRGTGTKEIGYKIPTVLQQLYIETNGALFGNYEIGGGLINKDGEEWYYELLPTDRMCRITDDGYCDPKSKILNLIRNWVKIIDCGDGNCLAINLNENGYGEIIDIFHETVGDEGTHGVIARNFEDWCELHIKSNTHGWWLGIDYLHVY